MGVTNIKTKLSILAIASLVTASMVCAGDMYKNNVVDLRINKELGNAVKVTIYTDKPYTEPIVVNKKANNKYVILMPETKSSLKSSPTVSDVSDTISNVTVNTQSVSGGKGYTKIVITSEKTITVVPRAQQLNTAAVKAAKENKIATSKVQTVSKKVDNKVAKAPEKPKKSVSKTVNKPVQSKPVTTKKVERNVQPKEQVVQPVKKPIEVLEDEIKTGQYASLPQPVEEKSETSTGLNNDDNIVEYDKKGVVENIKTLLRGYKNIDLWKLLLLASALTFPIIVLLVILNLDKKINKRINNTFKKEEEPKENIYSELHESNISDVNIPVGVENLSFDEVLPVVEQSVEEQNSVSEEFTNDYEDEDFVNNIAEEEQTEEVLVQNDYKEELPEVNDSLGRIEEMSKPEEVEEVHSEEVLLPAETQDSVHLEDYNPDGYLSDFAGVNDKDFFDELVIQTMATNNVDGLPDELPADEIFGFMSDDSEINAENTENAEETVSDEKTDGPVVNEEKFDSDNLTMLTEVKLNDKSSIYLVNYDDFSFLVGHIDDNYFVIKKFNELVSGRIFLKQTEQLENATRYIVRVGKNKMIVEVSDNSMSRLLDL